MENGNPQLFFEKFTAQPSGDFFPLAQSGSARKNFVGKSSGKKFIITSNENIAENESFFYFSDIFSGLNLNTPKILSVSEDRKIYVQEFLGENTLSDLLSNEGLNERTTALVKQTLEKLQYFQKETESKIDYSKTFEYERYDELPITNDLFYFKSFIADVLELPYQKSALLKEFKKITATIEDLQPQGLMIRDFQARNIIVNEKDEVFFIDYQSAMKGPLMYDVISFLFQAKANFPEDFKNEMLSYYQSLWHDEEVRLQLEKSIKPLQLIRFLQVLGAYGFRGLVQKKPHFIASLDKGIENLYHLSASWEEMNAYPELKKIITFLQTASAKEKIKNILQHS
ncbi:aminoglycoside phosphotransferase family protein [Chryseobacterium sp.]|uniref:aminoglycoside phosphotransferase family protein n=1 Tax=Chryseobacterium sp. TaxID=1871047 RepID=UPI0011C9AF95|nr:phosphotransferase [Chryseobacterium sp.]TXF76193.1 phosphotransferase [Chryseobacterium sp.]